MPIECTELADYLDEYLRIADVPDSQNALNGLQVESLADIRRVAVAVDACLATIAGAALWGAQLLVVHHGLFWGPKQPLIGKAFRRVGALIRHQMGVYSAHAALDAHPEVGNNAQLAAALGLTVEGTFGDVRGTPAGVYGTLGIDRGALVDLIREKLGVEARQLPYGLWQSTRVGIVAGSGAAYIADAARIGIDTLVTGEGPHHMALDAEEYGMNVVLAGHYATETLGVQALAEHLRERFGVETEFIDHPTGL